MYSRKPNARPVSRFLIDLNTVEDGNRLVSGHGAGGRRAAFLVILYSGFWDEWILAKDLMKITLVAYWCS